MMGDRLIAHVSSQSDSLHALLEESLGHFDAVGDIRGRGYFFGIELIADRERKHAFDPALELTDINAA